MLLDMQVGHKLGGTELKNFHEVSQSEVWQHWMRVEKTTDPNFRSDIRVPLPNDMVWYTAEIENNDIPKMFIISSGDWADISGDSFRVIDVAARIDFPTDNSDTERIGNDIRDKLMFLVGQRHSVFVGMVN